MKTNQISLCLALLCWPLASHSAEGEANIVGNSTNFLTVQAVVQEVLTNNPSLKAAQANWQAMLARVPQAKAWADLRAGVDVERDGVTFTSFHDNEWTLSQEFPLSGKNRKRARVAEAEAAATLTDLRRRELDLTARARAAYYRLANAYTQLEINQKNQALLEQLVELTTSKYALRARMQSDVLMVQTELAQLQEARRDLERELSDQQSALNVLMNRTAQAPLPHPMGAVFQSYAFDLEQTQQMALRHRPELLNAQKKIEAAETRIDLAKAEWIPDPELRLEARQFNSGSRNGINEYDTGIFINIPWLNRKKYKAAIEEAQKNKESAEHELAGLRTETLGMVRDELRKIETFKHHYHLQRDKLVPLARQSLEATRIAYTADKASILDLITAQRTVREVEAMISNHLTDYLVATAELQAMTGTGMETMTAAKP